MISDSDICKECGAWCCKHQFACYLKIGMDKVHHDYWKIRSVEYFELDGNIVYIVEQPCPYLEGWKCSIYEERPDICRLFPKRWVPEWAVKCELMKQMEPKRNILRVLGD